MERLVFLDGERATAFERCSGRFHRVGTFGADDEGISGYREWLLRAPRARLNVLVDVIDEAYQLERIPVVRRRERDLLLRRLGDKHFPDARYRCARIQGRDPAAGNSERVLACALARPDCVQPWLDPIGELGIALEGIASVPLVGESLLPMLGTEPTADVVLVSQQIPGTVRQSFYRQGRLAFARLVPVGTDPQGADEALARELERMLGFLQAQGWRASSQPVPICVLASWAQRDATNRIATERSDTAVHWFEPSALAQSLGLPRQAGADEAIAIHGQLMSGRRRALNHYAPLRLRRHAVARRARNALWALTAGLTLVAVLTSGAVWMAGRAYETSLSDTRERTERLRAELERRQQPLVSVARAPSRAQRVVETMGRLASTLPQQPGAAMAAVGNVLTQHPRVALTSLRIEMGVTKAAGQAQPGLASAGPAAPIEQALTGAPVAARIRIRGVANSDGKTAGLLPRPLHALKRDLRETPGLAEPALVAAPSGPRPAGEGARAVVDAGANGPGSFVLEVRWEPDDAAP